MSYLKISFGIFIMLAATRFVPHPPNFTSLVALSFYVPIFFGVKFIPIILLSFLITDLFIGMHSFTFFTWGSVLLISLLFKLFSKTFISRICGAITGTFVFFLISNFGVWILGKYTYTFEGFIACYVAALPFYGNTLISTLLCAILIEGIYKIVHFKRIVTIK